MKKLFAVLLTCTLLLSFSLLGYADSLDFVSMTYEQLAELKRVIDKEYYARPEAEPRILAPGQYIVGQDIEPGTYYACVNSYTFNRAGIGHLYLYESLEVYSAGGERLWHEQPCLVEPAVKVTLSTGNLLRVVYCAVTFSAEELTEEQQYKYDVPEGTYVPCGIYKVGEDIPAGRYQIYMGSLDGGEVWVYADESKSTKKDHVELDFLGNEHVKPLSIVDGDVVVVEHDVVFRKQEKLVFN